MKNNIDYIIFINYLMKGDILAAKKYKEKYIPSKIYKFMKLPEEKDELLQRIEQIIKGKIWMSKKRYLNDPFEFEMIDLMQLSLDERLYYDTCINELEITCFSEMVCNQAMWGYYASGKYGLCIEFSVENKDMLYPVEYIKEKPDYSKIYKNFFARKAQFVGDINLKFPHMPSDDHFAIMEMLQTMFCYKDLSWKHEKEIRCILKSEPSELDKILKNDCEMNCTRGSLHNFSECGIRINKVYFANHKRESVKELCDYICRNINKERYDEFCCNISNVKYEDLQEGVKSGCLSEKYKEIFCGEINFNKK